MTTTDATGTTSHHRAVNTIPAQHDPPGDRRQRQHPPHHDPRPHRPRRLLLAAVEGDERPQAVDVDDPAEPRRGDHREARHVVAGVLDGLVATLVGAHRRVDTLLDRAETADVPAADVDVVGRLAVGAEQRRAVVRRQQHGLAEPGEVVDHPRRHRQHRCADHEHRHQHPPRMARCPPPRQHGEAHGEHGDLAARAARRARRARRAGRPAPRSARDRSRAPRPGRRRR